MNCKNVSFFVLLLFYNMTIAQTVLPLYNGKIPNSKPCAETESIPAPGRVEGNYQPVLYIYYPQKRDSANTAVIICPGGGYARLAINHEGFQVAEALNKRGITAFVLKYRQPKSINCIEDPETVAQMDLQQAIKIVRDNATMYNINANNIGVLGFSAGGHLTATIGTHFTTSLIENKENTSLRPNFLVLAYPVISFNDSLAHKGSRENMLGKKPTKEKIDLYSNELQVTPQTPPSFLIHAADDKAVPVGNSISFYLALQKNNVPSEIHLYQKGGHGFGLNNKLEDSNWLALLFSWLKTNSFIKGNVDL
jgi:acetyl esterase/lipase